MWCPIQVLRKGAAVPDLVGTVIHFLLACVIIMATSVMRMHRALRSSGILLRNKKRLRTVDELTGVVKPTNVKPSTFVFNLPDELLEDILPLVDVQDLCSLSLVCSRLHRLSVRPSPPALACGNACLMTWRTHYRTDLRQSVRSYMRKRWTFVRRCGLLSTQTGRVSGIGHC